MKKSFVVIGELKHKDKDTVGPKIKAIYEQRNRTVGYRRIQDELYRQYRLVVNHKKVLRLSRTSVLKRLYAVNTSTETSYEAAVSDGRIAENLLKRNFKVVGFHISKRSDLGVLHYFHIQVTIEYEDHKFLCMS